MDRQMKAYLYAGVTVLLWSTVASAFKITLALLSFIEMLLGASLASLAALFIILLAQGETHHHRHLFTGPFLRLALWLSDF